MEAIGPRYDGSMADLITLRDLRYLLAVAEHEHFGRAAEACGVSQPTLSVQVRKLEEVLGVALFERASKAVTPTAACEQLIGHARAAVAAQSFSSGASSPPPVPGRAWAAYSPV